MSARRTGGVLRVAAAAIRREDGAVLLALRPRHANQGGKWEFPGGKLEPRESAVAGLARELDEELGIAIEAATPLITVRHDYPDRRIELLVFEVRAWRGEPHGREGQTVEWVAAEDLARREFPAANLPILAALRLPRLLLVT
ncbi:MAG: 8-oxo-dGTP diphosphatase MutT, partial [Gammaproteobacteria bacterium]